MGKGLETKRWLNVFLCSAGLACAVPVLSSSLLAADGAGDPAPAGNLFEVVGSEPARQQTVKVGATGQIDLHVDSLDITRVLQLLSIQSQRNIIASKNVAGNISADLYGVDFYEALDALLTTNGFGYEEKGQFIYVYTQQELAQREEANRQRVTRILRLSYVSAADIKNFVDPILSSGGRISTSSSVASGFEASISNGGENSFAHEDTLIIHDFEENVEQIVNVVRELDVRPKQVLIESTILQAQLTERNALGVDFAVFADLDVANVAQPLNAVGQMIDGTLGETSAMAIGTTSGGTTAGQSGIKLGFLGSDAALFVRALDQVTDTTVVARPKVLVLNRQRADLHVGRKLGYLSTTQTDTASTQSVEFLEVGTKLTVRPFVGAENDIRLELRPSLSDGSTRLEGGFIIPDETSQMVITNVIVQSGTTVVLGGFFKEDTSVGRNQVPGLGNIPIVGLLGRGQDDIIDRQEVIFMIKPTLMQHESLVKIGDGAEENIRLTRIGARRNLLPWSNTKLTSAHMRDAHKYLDEGNQDKALWHLNAALHIEPTMPDALALRARLTGEALYLHDQSGLESLINDVIGSKVGAAAPAADPAPAESQVPTTEELQNLLGSVAPTEKATIPGSEVATLEEPVTVEVAVAASEAVDAVPLEAAAIAAQVAPIIQEEAAMELTADDVAALEGATAQVQAQVQKELAAEVAVTDELIAAHKSGTKAAESLEWVFESSPAPALPQVQVEGDIETSEQETVASSTEPAPGQVIETLSGVDPDQVQ